MRQKNMMTNFPHLALFGFLVPIFCLIAYTAAIYFIFSLSTHLIAYNYYEISMGKTEEDY